MMIETLLWSVSLLIAIPASLCVVGILAYVIMKFGATGYYKAKRRDQRKQK